MNYTPVIKNKQEFSTRLLGAFLTNEEHTPPLTLQEIAVKTNIRERKILKFLSHTNKVKPTLQEVTQLAKVMSIDVLWLRGYNDDTEINLYKTTPW